MVSSVAAFEHFLDVHPTVKEIHNVIRPSGLVYVHIHPFTCPSGGHNVKLMEIPLRTLPKDVDDWDHLRKQRLPFHVPLNKWRIHQFLEELSKHLEVEIHYRAMREGKHFLTPEIDAELSYYTRDELTFGANVIMIKKA